MRANTFKTALSKKLGKQRVFYVCRDLERALFTKKIPKGIFIITNWNDFSRKKAALEKNIFLIRTTKQLDTFELLSHPETKKIIKKNDYVLVFKNTGNIEKIIEQNSWLQINPRAELANTIEEKISQYEWLGKLKNLLPTTSVQIIKNIPWKDKKFILQFNRAHTGQGTILIEHAEQLAELKKTFPNRPARVSRFVDGPVITVNLVIWGKKIFFGNPSYQITGLMPFTRSPFATIGNDWSLAREFLTTEKKANFKNVCLQVGEQMLKSGWQGLFGVDIIFSGNRAYLLEINARQPASTGFESQLQEQAVGRKKTPAQVSVFEAHLGALLGIKPEFKMIRIKDGAQIVKRYAGMDLADKQKKNIAKKLKDFQIIFYNNNKAESDQVRIQGTKGLLKSHNELNDLGRQIAGQFI